MGVRLRHHWAWRGARRMIALTAVFALLIAPIVVILTHGPAAHAVNGDTIADFATHSHGHGTYHDHGTHHDHGGLEGEIDGQDLGDVPAGGPFAGHDATDHDHQLQALICPSVGPWELVAGKAPSEMTAAFRGRTQDGPRRPPRAV